MLGASGALHEVVERADDVRRAERLQAAVEASRTGVTGGSGKRHLFPHHLIIPIGLDRATGHPHRSSQSEQESNRFDHDAHAGQPQIQKQALELHFVLVVVPVVALREKR